MRLSLPKTWLAKLVGCQLLCQAKVRAVDVSEPPQSWNGVKWMLHFTTPKGDVWLQENQACGTFDWRTVQFVALVPENATAAELVLGLEKVHGIAEFDDLSIRVYRPRIQLPTTPIPGQGPNGTAYIGHTGRLRGAMIGSVTADDLTEFGQQWHANHVRWQLIWGGFPRSPADTATAAEYDAWLDGELNRLDQLLPVCKAAGLRVVVDLHTPPGGRMEKESICQIFQRREDQEHLLRVWDKISKRYAGEPTVWGYDLVNEPVEGVVPSELMDWQTLAAEVARVIRQNDTEHAIIYEPAPWGSPDALQHTRPLPDDIRGVVYSVHMYVPHQFTHQGVYDSPVGVSYPGEIQGERWDKEQLRETLRPVVDFQRAYNVHIYLGEFSAIRWAPDESAYRYLRDCIELFEEFGWDWAYHAFREWDGW
ncbi:MAG: cellulase family glycosylhydrolase, partial [Thermoguttaceae bacterium]|nr:cellulase family glycosylhydrolase [Thermoguttaceae bacterium]